jgi:hypothetical protein
MTKDLSSDLRQAVDQAAAQLQHIGEEQAARASERGGWSKKEELGHLLDSAVNNHLRFARAALDGMYSGPGYEQEKWVELHGYRELPWTALVDLWQRHNWILSHMIGRLPSDRLNAECVIGAGPPVTLRFLIEDYVSHLRRHVAHILG